jgi:hypothetical protein
VQWFFKYLDMHTTMSAAAGKPLILEEFNLQMG